MPVPEWHPSAEEVRRIVDEMRPIIEAFAHGTQADLHPSCRHRVLVHGASAGSVARTAPKAHVA
jgi:hypothetical protein